MSAKTTFTPRPAKPGEMTRSQVFTYRVSSTVNGRTTVLYKSGNQPEARQVFETEAKRARAAGTDEKIALDAFLVEERECWSGRPNVSLPPKPSSVRFTGSGKGKLRILFVPLEMPVWTSARGWTYSANLAYARALNRLGHEVTVLNTLTIQYRDLLEAKPFDQVWTHLHFRHATDHFYREWLSETAPVRVGLAGESVFYSPEEKAASPWYGAQTETFEDWKPFLTHAAFVGPKDAELVSGRKDAAHLRATTWRQGVPESMIGPVIEKPQSELGIFCGAAYPPRDRWIFHPELRTLLAKPHAPEGPSFDGKFQRAHQTIHTYLRAIGVAPALALSLYHRRLSSLRYSATRSFIRALGAGSCVVNLPSMVKAYSGRVVEGMAAGRPVLSWAPAGELDVFEPGREIVHYGDTPEELADAIRWMQKVPDVAIDIARRARAKILAEHTVEKRAADLVRWVCEG